MNPLVEAVPTVNDTIAELFRLANELDGKFRDGDEQTRTVEHYASEIRTNLMILEQTLKAQGVQLD